jgi:acyl dehydratase
MRVFQSIEELKSALGQELGPSDWFRVEQERIDSFADATGDHQWIHVDVDRAARELPEGRTLAHGYLTLSLIPLFRDQIWRLASARHGLNYGLEKARFPAPVFSGDRLRLRQTLISTEPAAGGQKFVFRCVVEIEGRDKPACVADTVSILYEHPG